MNYLSILKCDTANSMTGFTVTLFVSGCARHCPGCFNPESWSCEAGKPFDEEARNKIFSELDKQYCRGLSLLGGEPLSRLSDNRRQVIELAREVKRRYPDKDIYLWTGYTLDEIRADDSMSPILEYVDYLIDGPFIQELRNPDLLLRGSANQHLVRLHEK